MLSDAYCLRRQATRPHPQSREETASGRRLLVGTLYHLYYVFSSTLLASCREAMTERCGLAAEFFYSVGSTTGDLCLFCRYLI
ncbi:hypothetical protein [Nostoc sp.]